ncbi:FAD-dependent oxidoreductase [Gloeobacter kilaueensis]|uniref:D-amino-acid oxidase n=1 Tax=Gloeobacter kilaueensis (strain ATCC BAA-2537 / CCAP 1431/1 / ULC 316 / JS1) TaxID=1183438 RepID=U5QRF4_GLOK1|nr:FAD-dependent oxidoreductase [Gloeobacter kilaueensis]AGY60229.1 D-amino acid oxidase [Gloeobacter kilaueensis JS1]
MKRRRLLGAATLIAATNNRAAAQSTRSRPLARVQVSFERIVRTVVGLRPYRPTGFVLRSEVYGDKVIVHNYGHGGGGVSLSWGTAQLATDLAAATGRDRYAVLGCGAVGLATARLLQDRGFAVTIYAAELPPQTTSNIAGAQWSPVSVFEPEKISPAFSEQFVLASQLSYRYFQNLVGDHYGVRWIENYYLGEQPDRSFIDYVRREGIVSLYPDIVSLQPGDHAFAARYVTRFMTMLIEPPVYLNAVLRDFLLRGGTVRVQRFADRKQILALEEATIVNCTGLGAKSLFVDDELIPIKGQLSVLLPQPEIDYLTLAPDALYMFPRRDGILLGGTFERGVGSPEVNEPARTRIVGAHAQIFAQMHERLPDCRAGLFQPKGAAHPESGRL